MYTSFQDALKAVLNDRRIRREDWKDDIYVTLEYGTTLRDQSGTAVDLVLNNRENIKDAIEYKWEILPTTEEILLIKGKAYDVRRHCYDTNICCDCVLERCCAELSGLDEVYLNKLFKSESWQKDNWFRKNMHTINEMWEMIKDE